MAAAACVELRDGIINSINPYRFNGSQRRVYNRGGTGEITKVSLKIGEENAIKVAIAAVECLI